MISKLDLMKLFSQYEGEISMSDFTPEELEAYLREAEGAEAPLSPAEWKARYFEYYDDVKDKAEYDLQVIRFTNRQIDENFYGVCEYIDLVVKNILSAAEE